MTKWITAHLDKPDIETELKKSLTFIFSLF